MYAQAQVDTRSATLTAVHGRDAGKLYEVREVDPLTMSGYMLRLASALRVPSFDVILGLLAPSEGEDGPNVEAIDALLRILQGADPQAVHALITEALQYVRVAPDPQHPGAFRALMLPADIRELRTLGEVLRAFVPLHTDTGS